MADFHFDFFTKDIVSKTYVSKAKFDGGLLSETFSVMNLLYDFDHCKTSKGAFCKLNC